jgi:choice-of-anchor C domain-containing protein
MAMKSHEERMGMPLIGGRRVLAGALVIAAFGVVTTAALATNLAGNGGFEKPKLVSGFQTFSAGQTIGGTWHVDSGSADVVTTTTLAAAKGRQSLDLDGGSVGAVSEPIATTAGHDYKLGFKLAGNPLCGVKVKTLSVRWNGSEIGHFTFDTTGKTPTNMGWVGKKAVAHATGSTSTLAFVSLDGAGSTCGPEIDAVKVVLK